MRLRCNDSIAWQCSLVDARGAARQTLLILTNGLSDFPLTDLAVWAVKSV